MFLTIFKYLAFVACAAKAPITQKTLDITLERIDAAGESENIRRWCLWTPIQMSLMKMATELKRVILIGGNGTGKTTLLDAFARKIKNGRVIVAIKQEYVLAHVDSSEFIPPFRESLLHLNLENKYEKSKNITIQRFKSIDELTHIKSHIFIDEVDMSDISLEEMHSWQNMAAKTVMIVVRNTPIDANRV